MKGFSIIGKKHITLVINQKYLVIQVKYKDDRDNRLYLQSFPNPVVGMDDILQTNNLYTRTWAKFHGSPEMCLEDLGDDLEKKFIRLIKGKRKKKVQVLWLEVMGSSPNSAITVWFQESRLASLSLYAKWEK